jgi:hypothetical protein
METPNNTYTENEYYHANDDVDHINNQGLDVFKLFVDKGKPIFGNKNYKSQFIDEVKQLHNQLT